jgi:cobalt-zinc-cadmium efflux system membrane fusion protein
MNLFRAASLKPLGIVLVVLIVVVAGAAYFIGVPGSKELYQPVSGAEKRGEALKGVTLDPKDSDALIVPKDVLDRLKIKTDTVTNSHSLPLVLTGSLALDPQTLGRIRSRFSGEVIEVASRRDDDASRAAATSKFRPLRLGDKVDEGELLAVVWSKDLGEKKSELVDAQSQLLLDEKTLKRYKDGYPSGGIPDFLLLQQERAVKTDRIAVDRAERTLRTWKLKQSEIDALKALARPDADRKELREREEREDWARVEIWAPYAGVIVERNVVKGDIIDSTLDMFKLANMKKLAVWTHAYEEDVPALQRLDEQRREKGLGAIPWTIRLRKDTDQEEEVPGTITNIGRIVDPTQHTVIIMGEVDNPKGQLKAGQWIKATVELPPPPGEVSIPIGALVEDGKDSVVFVQTDPKENRFAMKRVAVTRRGLHEAQVRSELRPNDKKAHLQALQLGDRVVISGALELKAALDDRQEAAQASAK